MIISFNCKKYQIVYLFIVLGVVVLKKVWVLHTSLALISKNINDFVKQVYKPYLKIFCKTNHWVPLKFCTTFLSHLILNRRRMQTAFIWSINHMESRNCYFCAVSVKVWINWKSALGFIQTYNWQKHKHCLKNLSWADV